MAPGRFAEFKFSLPVLQQSGVLVVNSSSWTMYVEPLKLLILKIKFGSSFKVG